MLQKEEGLQREVGPQGIYSPHAVEKANELANVEKSIYEHRDLLRQISSYPYCARRDPHAVTCQRCMAECLSECEALLDKYATLANPLNYVGKGEKAEDGEGQTGEGGEEDEEKDDGVKRRPSYTPQLIKAKSAKCFDKRLKTLQELCDKPFYEGTMELLKETEKNFRGELCYLHTLRLDRALRRKQRVTNFLFEEDLREDEEHEGGKLKPFCAVNHTKDSNTALHPPPIVLVPQPQELDSLEPSDPLDPASETSHTQESELGFVDSHLESSPSDQTLETQESSEETKGSFSSDKSGASQAENQQIIPNLKPEPADLDSNLTQEPDPNTDLERESSSEEMETTAGEDEGGDQTPVSLLDPDLELEASREDCEMESELLVPIDTACCMAQEGFLQETSVSEVMPHLGQSSRPLPLQTLVVNQEPQALLPLKGDYAVGSPCSERPTAGLELPSGLFGDAVSHCSVEDGSDCTMSASTGSDQAASPLGYGGVVTLRQRKKAGQGALRFVRQYPFALQALWCLLSGRTLVVLGADEGRVRRLVAALALFVPGPGKCGERVQAWLSSPFTLTDLERWKLIGLQRYE